MIETALLALAALCGAAGVALLAAAAHTAPGMHLDSAAQVLLFHAPATFALVLAAAQGLVRRPLGLVAATAFLLGAVLFAGDLTLRAFAGHSLFSMAAPTGGTILIAGWLIAAVAALARRRSPD
jgi:uncharacterized membrane protein YgdD (TMEM256/DUF423 family)